ncbi:MAG: hypothetical protein RL154_742, partial [Pseudomonadota bacterium]
EEVIKASLTKDSVSSRVSLDSILSVEANIKPQDNIEIPSRYYRNYLKVLPVNVQTVFVYWEVTSALLEEKSASLPLVIKLFDTNEPNELLRFGIYEEVGSTYLNAYWNEKKLTAEIGYVSEDGVFVPILSSGKLSMPSDKLHIAKEQTWMKKVENFEEIIRASISYDTPSSSSLTKQMQLAFYDARLNSLSSFSITQ